MAEHATDRLEGHRQAIALLAEYVASGRPNGHLDHFCGCCLQCAGAWRRDPPYGGRLAFLETDYWTQMQEAYQMGERQREAFETALGNPSRPWGSALEKDQASAFVGAASGSPTLAHVASDGVEADQTPPRQISGS
jgi:hypothetical protein